MPGRTPIGFYSCRQSGLCLSFVAIPLAVCLTSCVSGTKPSASSRPPAAQPAAQVRPVSVQTGAIRATHIVLPNSTLVGCQTSDCYHVLPDSVADQNAIYPWQVRLDFNQSAIIGLIALYDQPTTIDEVQAAVDKHYEKWAMADFRTGPVRLWRVDPPKKFAINLAVNEDGMVQLIYLSYDARHPTSDQGSARILRDCQEHDNSNGFGCAMIKKALAAH